MALPRVTELAHDLLGRHLRKGDRAIDATVGNGHDTVFLAECVGGSGRVDGFEIQAEALAATRTRTAPFPQVHLHHLGHEWMGQVVAEPVEAVVFNLGYLPGGDKHLVTRPETTLAALDTALALLAPTGLLSVVVYPGHPEGITETEAVEAWFRETPSLRVVRYGPLGQKEGRPPYLLAAERRG